jgi:hypothetical protein
MTQKVSGLLLFLFFFFFKITECSHSHPISSFPLVFALFFIDVIARVNVWQLEGDDTLKSLLPLALHGTTLSDSLAVIVVDFSRPWEAARTLRRWLSVLEQHIASLKELKPKDLLEELRNSQVQRWQKYKEPDPSAAKKRRKEITTRKEKVSSALIVLLISVESFLMFILPLLSQETTEQTQNSAVPLPSEVFTSNFGIPIIVVCTKSDASETLQKDYDFKDGRLDYIQTYLRRICLNCKSSPSPSPSPSPLLFSSLLFSSLLLHLLNFSHHSIRQMVLHFSILQLRKVSELTFFESTSKTSSSLSDSIIQLN